MIILFSMFRLLERLLNAFSFTTAKAVLDDLGVWQQAPISANDHG
ncbi:MAG: hypothetical protein ABFS45_09555 [Pseudomonadota bacterium]